MANEIMGHWNHCYNAHLERLRDAPNQHQSTSSRRWQSSVISSLFYVEKLLEMRCPKTIVSQNIPFLVDVYRPTWLWTCPDVSPLMGIEWGYPAGDTGYFPTPKTGHFPTPKNGYFPTRVLQNLIVIETQISTKKGNGHFPTQLPQKLMTGG